MAATYVTNAELRTALGIGTLYADSVVEEVCQSAQNIISSKLWRNDSYISNVSVSKLVATVYFLDPTHLYVGQSVTISGIGDSNIDGARTLAAITDFTAQFATVSADFVKRFVMPFGKASAAIVTDYSTVPEVREASLIVAVDIWQARNSSNSGGVSPDFTPSPYKMGNTLLARVRGLLAGYIAPSSMVG